MGKTITFLLVLLCTVVSSYGQCAEEQTVTVCDMTTVDGNGDGNADGIINLYEELSTLTGTTITAADGTWFDPDFNFALDMITGDLFLWDLPASSQMVDDYQFELLDPTSGCPNDVVYVLNVVLGAFSGTAAQTMGDEVNLQVCQGAPPSECGATTMIDLFQIFLSNPSPHSNGQWTYMGTSPNFIGVTQNRFLNVNVPYTPGPPLVDEETFMLEYTVPGITPCAPEQVTTVRVSVVKEPFAGFANAYTICETELLDGDFDLDINLRDDAYLVNENIEGTWDFANDPTGQISGSGDSIINLRQVYDDLVAVNPQFGCATFEYTYRVESRSIICSDQQSTISFTFYEFIRPFSQEIVPEFCVDDPTVTSANLYDFIAFTNEGGVEFEYPDDSCTNWTFISGPSDLGLVSNTGDICSVLEDPNYTSQGTIDLTGLTDNSAAGTYVFEFTVNESYHCTAMPEVIHDTPDGCSATTTTVHPCEPQSTQVTIIVNPINYAGEDTTGLEFCETESPIVLTDQLETNDVEGPVFVGPEGTWIDLADGSSVDNTYTIPEITTDSQVFNFEYTTTTASGCSDSALLTFTVFQQYDAGESGSLVVCEDDGIVDLFTLLGGTPDANGTWTGPNGFSTTDNVALFDPATGTEGEYTYTVPENTTCPSASAIVNVTVGEALYAGEDTAGVEICESLQTVDLFTLLNTNGIDTIDMTGQWIDETDAVIVNPFTIPEITNSEVFEFTYTTISPDGCAAAATLSFTIFEQSDAGTDGEAQLCMDAAMINLFDFLEGTPDTTGTWSGPNGYTTTDNNAPFTPMTDASGDYIYTTPSNGACNEATATIMVSFFATPYAGEDTAGVEICDISAMVDLTTLLDTNGQDTVATTGTWTDVDAGTVIANPFTIPIIDSSQVFNFMYNTSTSDGCMDAATLSFTVFQSGDAGIGATVTSCEDGNIINLFDNLTGTPDTDGTWTGPGGYSDSGTGATIDPSVNVSGSYIYTVMSNGTCAEVTSTVTINISPLSDAGDDINTIVCPGDYTLNLFDLLSVSATTTGVFTDLLTGETITDGLVEVIFLGSGSFSYDYTVTSGVCDPDSATLNFTITPVATPGIVLEEYCINDGTTLGDVQVTGTDDFAWYASAEAEDPLSLSTLLLDEEVYFLAAIDENGCESERVAYVAQILPLDNTRCGTGISNGVSDNDDGTNDTLELGSLPVVFPDFELQIFNRYGTVIYEGNRNTPLFDGSSNTGSTLGDQLPTGVYFYIFNPNSPDAQPIDGNFYLSR